MVSGGQAIVGARQAASTGSSDARHWRFDPIEWEIASGRVSTEPSSHRWHVLHTRSRQEKALVEILEATGVECFLPLVRKVRHYGHRRRRVDVPLFPSYVFLWGPLEATYAAISTKRAVGAVRVADQLRLDRELHQIRLALDGEADLDPYPFLEKGRPVRVTGGPFRGIEGLVEDRRSPHRLVLQIHTLGRATALEIDPSLLEPVD